MRRQSDRRLRPRWRIDLMSLPVDIGTLHLEHPVLNGSGTFDAIARLVRAVGSRPEVEAVELNVSCPNVESGLIIGERPEETLALVEALRSLTDQALIVKLTPNVADPAAVALAAEAGGADAVSLVN